MSEKEDEENTPGSRMPSPENEIEELQSVSPSLCTDIEVFTKKMWFIDQYPNLSGGDELLFTPKSGKRLLLETNEFIDENLSQSVLYTSELNHATAAKNIVTAENQPLGVDDDHETTFSESIEKLIHDLSTDASRNESCDTMNISSSIANNDKSIEKVPKNKKRDRNPKSRLDKTRANHPLLPPCKVTCSKKCTSKLSEDERFDIWDTFWHMDIQRRRDYISRNTKLRKVSVKYTRSKKRNNTIIWSLAGHIVCKTMFLHTIGYQHDSVVFSILRANYKSGLTTCASSISAAPDLRGKHKPRHAFSEHYVKEIKDFIEACRPTHSHYNIEHAPNRRYFPAGYKEKDVFKLLNEFLEDKGLQKCGWSSFRKILKQINVSGCQPAQDLCTKCKLHDIEHPIADKEHDCTICQCAACNGYQNHKKNKDLARAHLLEDTNVAEKSNGKTVLYTADMQKVIMMPKMTIKDAFFSRKLTLFNETYASPGKNKTAIAVLWHEGESGRKAHNIASSLLKFVVNHCRDAEHLILYMDNCSSQNKNKILYSALFRMINSPNTTLTSIKIEYLEPGHTFMAADSVHACITKKMSKTDNMYDFQDFVEVIQSSRKNLLTEIVQHNDIILFTDELKKSFPKGFNISNHKIIKFERGFLKLFVKTEYDQLEFTELDILSMRLKKDLQMRATEILNLPRQENPLGVSKIKKTDLMKLTVSMPHQRRAFYEKIVTRDTESEESDN